MSKKEAKIINNFKIKPSTSSSSSSSLKKVITKDETKLSPNLYTKNCTQNINNKKHCFKKNYLNYDDSLHEDNSSQSKHNSNSIYSGQTGLSTTLSYLETEKALFNKIFNSDKNEKQTSNSTFNNQTQILNEKNLSNNFQNQAITNNVIEKKISNSNFVNNNQSTLKNKFTTNTKKTSYLQVPTQTFLVENNSVGQFPLLYNENLMPTTSNSQLSYKILEESYNKRKASYSPLYSITKLNDLRKKSVSELNIILEVIRNAAMPVENNKNKYYNLRNNKRDATSLSPYLVKNVSSNNYLNEKSNECISLSAENLNIPSKTSTSNKNTLQNLDKVQRCQSFLSTPTLPVSDSIIKKFSRSLSPLQNISRISSYIWYKRNSVNKIRWKRFSPHYIQKQIILGKINYFII